MTLCHRVDDVYIANRPSILRVRETWDVIQCCLAKVYRSFFSSAKTPTYSSETSVSSYRNTGVTVPEPAWMLWTKETFLAPAGN